MTFSIYRFNFSELLIINMMSILFVYRSHPVFASQRWGVQSVLSRAVVILFASLFASQGLSPWSRTVPCVPYDTITPVSRHVLAVSRAIYYEIALSF